VPGNVSCTSYFDNPKTVHPSEPNYIWLEAGDNLGFTNDDDPSASHILTTSAHLTAYLDKAGVTWREYAEGIDGKTCPLVTTGNYAPKHVPFVFFSDVVGNPPSSQNAYCIAHMRSHATLQGDLMSGAVAAYNFITPDLCDDMHDACTGDAVSQGDTWLSNEVSMITASQVYKSGGAIFITWDESEGGSTPLACWSFRPLRSPPGTRAR
jgi:phospholipase C